MEEAAIWISSSKLAPNPFWIWYSGSLQQRLKHRIMLGSWEPVGCPFFYPYPCPRAIAQMFLQPEMLSLPPLTSFGSAQISLSPPGLASVHQAPTCLSDPKPALFAPRLTPSNVLHDIFIDHIYCSYFLSIPRTSGPCLSVPVLSPPPPTEPGAQWMFSKC
jgi:hypothetical protein